MGLGRGSTCVDHRGTKTCTIIPEDDDGFEITRPKTRIEVDMPQRLTRRERERERHRFEVIEAAERLLRVKHYQEVGVKAIAEEAEFSVGYLYKLFPNKEEIILSIVRQKLDERLDLIRRSLEREAAFGDHLRDLVATLEEWQQQNMLFHPSVIGAIIGLIESHPGIAHLIGNHDVQVRVLLDSFFRGAVDQGYLYHDEPALITDTFEASMKGFLIRNIRNSLGDTTGLSVWQKFGSMVEKVILRTFDPSWTHGRGGTHEEV